MDRSTEDQTALAMVRLGYALDDPTDSRRCLHFRVGFDDQESAYEALQQINYYNDFHGSTIVAALREAMPRGSMMPISIDVGREGSPVVYLRRVLREDSGDLQAALLKAHADEVDYADNEIRAWWD